MKQVAHTDSLSQGKSRINQMRLNRTKNRGKGIYLPVPLFFYTFFNIRLMFRL